MTRENAGSEISPNFIVLFRAGMRRTGLLGGSTLKIHLVLELNTWEFQGFEHCQLRSFLFKILTLKIKIIIFISLLQWSLSNVTSGLCGDHARDYSISFAWTRVIHFGDVWKTFARTTMLLAFNQSLQNEPLKWFFCFIYELFSRWGSGDIAQG